MGEVHVRWSRSIAVRVPINKKRTVVRKAFSALHRTSRFTSPVNSSRRSRNCAPVPACTCLNSGQTSVGVNGNRSATDVAPAGNPEDSSLEVDGNWSRQKNPLLPSGNCAGVQERRPSPIARAYPAPGKADPGAFAVVAPAYNEALVIGSVVLLAKKHTDRVIVVDDGSTDRTAETARLAGADVIRMPQNGGKAKAMMAGFARARELGYEAVVMLDGDGQHDPEEIPAVAAPVLAGVADLVIGSRFLDTKAEIPAYRRAGQMVLNGFTNLSVDGNFATTDSQSGFRALSRRALENLTFASEGYNIESDMIAHFAPLDLRITEVPISVTYDVPHKHKKNPVSHGFGVLARILGLIGSRRILGTHSRTPARHNGNDSITVRADSLAEEPRPLRSDSRPDRAPEEWSRENPVGPGGSRSDCDCAWHPVDEYRNLPGAGIRRIHVQSVMADSGVADDKRENRIGSMKILRVSSNLYPSVVGGLGLHAHEMSRLQAEAGHDVTVFTDQTDSGQPVFEERDGYSIIRSNTLPSLFGNTISFSQLFSLFKHWDSYDIVHAHSHLFFSTVLCTAVRKFRSTPLVVTNHGLVSQTAPGWLQRLYLPTIGKWIFATADAVICYTRAERDQVVDLGVSPDKIHVIHNGIDTGVFVPSESSSPKKQILWIGRFTPGKGVDFLLEGFEAFSRKFPDYTLVAVGRGPLRDNFIRMVREAGLEDRVIIRDFTPNGELPGLYQDSSLFVLPSLEEGVPRTILESMACGRPVVCTALPQLVDIVSGCGMLVPTGDAGAVADALSTLVSDPALARSLGRSAREKVVSQYSWDDTVARTLDLYASLLHPASRDRNTSRISNAAEKSSKLKEFERIDG
jgi:glycosyltransferase involved in cell wall biosynthesis